MEFLAEFWRFMRVRKKFWLLPILVMMVVFGGLLVLTKRSAVAPFIYTLLLALSARCASLGFQPSTTRQCSGPD